MNTPLVPELPQPLAMLSYSPVQTVRIGVSLGEQLRVGDVVLLYGDFGAGKTHFTKGIAQGLGSDDMVNSPSFVLINQYRAGLAHARAPIFHIDLYRIDNPAALGGIGLDDALDGHGICIIEWAERVGDWLPPEALAVSLRHVDATTRTLNFVPHGPRAASLIDHLRPMTFD